MDFLVSHCLRQETGFCPALVLLDLNMPIMNGFEFLEAFRQQPPLQQAGVTIIVVSSSLQEEDNRRVANYGVAGFIEKPLTKEKLKAILSEANMP
ncbi:response regulator [Rhodocytophaga rosea]|uniref:Response regulator n=1 Tax=Rhodocytophaga rosea TaxID=2704465 RepID=A0A6C0GHW7_9BACT|nr:response regulator [Rhodocytophaga rosea]